MTMISTAPTILAALYAFKVHRDMIEDEPSILEVTGGAPLLDDDEIDKLMQTIRLAAIAQERADHPLVGEMRDAGPDSPLHAAMIAPYDPIDDPAIYSRVSISMEFCTAEGDLSCDSFVIAVRSRNDEPGRVDARMNARHPGSSKFTWKSYPSHPTPTLMWELTAARDGDLIRERIVAADEEEAQAIAMDVIRAAFCLDYYDCDDDDIESAFSEMCAECDATSLEPIDAEFAGAPILMAGDKVVIEAAPPRVVVGVHGGLVQWVIADRPGVRVFTVDCDIEEDDAIAEGYKTIVDPDGDEYVANAGEEGVSIDPAFVDRVEHAPVVVAEDGEGE